MAENEEGPLTEEVQQDAENHEELPEDPTPGLIQAFEAEEARKQPPPEEAPPQDEIDEELSLRAEEYGFDPRHFGSEDNLRAAIRTMDSQIAQIGRNAGRSPDAPPPRYQRRDDEPPPRRDAEHPPQDGFRFEVDDEDLDPKLARSLRAGEAFINRLANENRSLTQRLEQFENASREQAYAAVVNFQDQWTESLGKDFADLLGRGPESSLRDPRARAARKAIREEAEALVAGYQQTNRPVPTTAELFRRALNNLFPKEATRARRTKDTERVERASRQTSYPPAGRSGKRAPGQSEQERLTALVGKVRREVERK